jgi:hypothetical protein
VASVVPTGLALPGRRLAPVVAEEATDGALGIPENVGTLGWWRGGAGLDVPAGSIVIAGHIDSATQGIGYFAALRDVAPGASVTVRGSDGRTREFLVTGRRTYAKARGLPPGVFDQQVALRLVLITCTGRFDQGRRSYDDNLVVYAVPAG